MTALERRRGRRRLFAGVGFALHAGQALWLRGRNGCGKTSLLRPAAGLARHDAPVRTLRGW